MDKENKNMTIFEEGSRFLMPTYSRLPAVFKKAKMQYLYDFNDKKYSKDYVYQVHCGHGKGKHLSCYVIQKENEDKCFLPNKTIRTKDIDKWFKSH